MTLEPELQMLVDQSSFAETLFDRVPDVVFFIKDRGGRYAVVNQTLVERCGLRNKTELLGRTARRVFPSPLGNRFFEQDKHVLSSGIAITQNLELHLYPTRLEGWCLTDKMPLIDSGGSVIGVAGISRDLQSQGPEADLFAEVATVLDHIRSHFGTELRVAELAGLADLSVYQLNRRLRAIFGITTIQFITKTRIDAASEMLRLGDLSIAEISYACGYYDQSAFSRVFRRTVGLTPRQYRARHQTRSH
jgi:AraC-like DNA-binding protein